MDTDTAAVLMSLSSAGWLATAGYTAHLTRRLRTDPLTGLPNREALALLVRRAARRSGAPGRCVGVLLCDLDRFKRINDVHGHGVGNTVLQIVAGHLGAVAEPGEVPIRLHGDEFALWLGLCPTPEAGVAHAQRRAVVVRGALCEPITVSRRLLAVTASVGAAVLPVAGLTGPALLAKADHAMYQAKRAAYRTTHTHPTITRPRAGEDAA